MKRVCNTIKVFNKDGTLVNTYIFDESQEVLFEKILGYIYRYNIPHEIEAHDPYETL